MLILRKATARRFAAAALATALSVLAAPLVSIEHEATVRHVICLDHGELVDAAPLTPQELAAPEHHHSRNVVEQGEGAPASTGDVHCLLADWHHQRSTPPHGGDSVSPPQPVREAVVPAAPDRRPAAIALLALAPKLSPPLA